MVSSILFFHQNFPGRYRHLAAALARTPGWQVAALGDTEYVRWRSKILRALLVGYSTPPAASQFTHHYMRPLKGAVRRG